MSSKIDVVPCPNGCGTLLRPEYKDRYGQCIDCYLPLDAKLAKLSRSYHR